MIQNVLSSIGGVGVYGVISIAIFFAFFVGMLIWAFRLKKPYLNSMGALPLEDETKTTINSNPDSRHE
jgi:hypothetical protein